jgi:hypothetical protein
MKLKRNIARISNTFILALPLILISGNAFAAAPPSWCSVAFWRCVAGPDLGGSILAAIGSSLAGIIGIGGCAIGYAVHDACGVF